MLEEGVVLFPETMWERGRKIWKSGGQLALMLGAPRAAPVQLSPLPVSAHNKSQCATAGWGEKKKKLTRKNKKKKTLQDKILSSPTC